MTPRCAAVSVPTPRPRMVSHLVAVVIWIVATIMVFHLLDIDAAFFLSSAGFLGAAIAIGGQHKVNDYLTGIGVLFEDRYGVGDEIVVDPGDGVPVSAVVDHIGLFSTRLKDSRSTLHVPNSALTTVRNLSQEAAVSTIRLHVPGDATADEAMSTLRGLAGTDGLTDVIFVGDLDAHEPNTGEVEVEVRTARTARRPLEVAPRPPRRSLAGSLRRSESAGRPAMTPRTRSITHGSAGGRVSKRAETASSRGDREQLGCDQSSTGPALDAGRRWTDLTLSCWRTARWVAARWRRMARRSSSERPPQMPESWLVSRAKSRHSCTTAHCEQTRLA